jgi:hypothetical protein
MGLGIVLVNQEQYLDLGSTLMPEASMSMSSS